jgi:hypothetical protein
MTGIVQRMEIIRTLLAGVAGGGLVAFFAWLLRESIKAALQRDLTAQAERLKYELQREMLKAQLSTEQLHLIYPKLAGKLRRAEGAVGDLQGIRFAPSYEGYDVSDFEAVLKDLRLPGAERARLLAALERDRGQGVRELEKTVRRVEKEKARVVVNTAQNFIILKALYLSSAVKEGSFAATKTLWDAWVDLDISAQAAGAEGAEYFTRARQELASAAEQIKAVENLMQQELQPREASRLSG